MFRCVTVLGYSPCPLKKENLVMMNPPNSGAEGTMSLLDRSLRRVEEAGTGKDGTEMGLPKNLPEMHETKVPATDHFHLKYSMFSAQVPSSSWFAADVSREGGEKWDNGPGLPGQNTMPLSSPLQCQSEGRRVLPT